MKNAILTIIEIGAKGDGVALHEGAAFYIPKTAPGDVVEATIQGERGALQKIVTPSAHRAEAPCPYFESCGGCSLQHVTPEFYRGWKIARIEKELARAGVRAEKMEEPIFLPATDKNNGRRRTTLAALKTKTGIILGYNRSRSHEILDIRSCLILRPGLDAKAQMLRPFLPALLGDAKACDITLQYIDGVLDVLLTGPLQQKGRFSLGQNEAFGGMMESLDIARLSWRARDFAPAEIILSRKPVFKKSGALNISLPPAAFLQASEEGEEALVAIVLKHTANAATIADLFCGCGTFAGPLLQTGATITAIDSEGAAISALAATNHPRLTALRRDLFKNPLTETELSAFDTVIFDPPRAGAAAQAERLAWSGVPTLIGISCNPASFARDAATLQGGGYRLASLTLIDQFVWSAHVELVSVFLKS